MMNLNLHIYPSRFTNESRIFKTVKSLQESGLVQEVHMVGIHEQGLEVNEAIGEKQMIWRVKLTLPLFIPGIKSLMQKIEWYYRIIVRFRKENISVVHCHSITDLPAGVCLKTLKKGTKLVYEAHELETETVWLAGFKKKFNKILERLLIKYADEMIVVSESICEWYRNKYPKLNNITVIKNVPVRIGEAPPESNILRDELGINEDCILVIYHGMLSSTRGIDLLLDVFSEIDKKFHIVFMGFGKEKDLINKFKENHENIHLISEVEPEQVVEYAASADIGIHLIPNTCLNHYYCLPNKVFEYILAGLPIIVRDYPDMGRLVDENDCGWKVNDDKEEIKALIQSIKPAELELKKQNVLNARNKFGWQVEEKKLFKVYESLMS